MPKAKKNDAPAVVLCERYEIVPVANGFILQPSSSGGFEWGNRVYVFPTSTAMADFIDDRFVPKGEQA